MFTSLPCCSEPNNPPVVHADTNTTPLEEHPATGNVCTVPDKVRKMHKLEDYLSAYLFDTITNRKLSYLINDSPDFRELYHINRI